MQYNVVKKGRQIAPAQELAGERDCTDWVERSALKTCKNIRIMMWNPCSIVKDSRRLEISRAFRSIDVGGLIGTRIRRPEKTCRHTFQRGKYHNYVHFGWFPGVFTNKSAGCSVMLSKRIDHKSVKKIEVGPDDLAGRAGSVRIDQGPLRIKAIVAYFAPRPKRASELPAWNVGCKKLMEWVEKQVKGW